jgi:hypothetical protein
MHVYNWMTLYKERRSQSNFIVCLYLCSSYEMFWWTENSSLLQSEIKNRLHGRGEPGSAEHIAVMYWTRCSHVLNTLASCTQHIASAGRSMLARYVLCRPATFYQKSPCIASATSCLFRSAVRLFVIGLHQHQNYSDFCCFRIFEVCTTLPGPVCLKLVIHGTSDWNMSPVHLIYLRSSVLPSAFRSSEWFLSFKFSDCHLPHALFASPVSCFVIWPSQ